MSFKSPTNSQWNSFIKALYGLFAWMPANSKSVKLTLSLMQASMDAQQFEAYLKTYPESPETALAKESRLEDITAWIKEFKSTASLLKNPRHHFMSTLIKFNDPAFISCVTSLLVKSEQLTELAEWLIETEKTSALRASMTDSETKTKSVSTAHPAFDALIQQYSLGKVMLLNTSTQAALNDNGTLGLLHYLQTALQAFSDSNKQSMSAALKKATFISLNEEIYEPVLLNYISQSLQLNETTRDSLEKKIHMTLDRQTKLILASNTSDVSVFRAVFENRMRQLIAKFDAKLLLRSDFLLAFVRSAKFASISAPSAETNLYLAFAYMALASRTSRLSDEGKNTLNSLINENKKNVDTPPMSAGLTLQLYYLAFHYISLSRNHLKKSKQKIDNCGIMLDEYKNKSVEQTYQIFQSKLLQLENTKTDETLSQQHARVATISGRKLQK